MIRIGKEIFIIAFGLFYKVNALYSQRRGRADESEYNSDGPSSLIDWKSWALFELLIVVLAWIQYYQRRKRNQKK